MTGEGRAPEVEIRGHADPAEWYVSVRTLDGNLTLLDVYDDHDKAELVAEILTDALARYAQEREAGAHGTMIELANAAEEVCSRLPAHVRERRLWLAIENARAIIRGAAAVVALPGATA